MERETNEASSRTITETTFAKTFTIDSDDEDENDYQRSDDDSDDDGRGNNNNQKRKGRLSSSSSKSTNVARAYQHEEEEEVLFFVHKSARIFNLPVPFGLDSDSVRAHLPRRTASHRKTYIFTELYKTEEIKRK